MSVLPCPHLSPTSQAVGGRWGRFLIQLLLQLSAGMPCRDDTALIYCPCLLFSHILFTVPILGQTYSFSYLPMSDVSCLFLIPSSCDCPFSFQCVSFCHLSPQSQHCHSCLVTDRLLSPRMHKSGISYAMPSCSKTLYILYDQPVMKRFSFSSHFLEPSTFIFLCKVNASR